MQLNGVYFVDIAKGTPGVIPAIMQPTEIEQQIAWRKKMVGEMPALDAQALALTRTRDRLNKAWQKNDLPPALRTRFEAISRLLSEANAAIPEIQQLLRMRNEAVRAQTAIQDVIFDFVQTGFLDIQKRHKSETSEDVLRTCARSLAKTRDPAPAQLLRRKSAAACYTVGGETSNTFVIVTGLA